MNSHSLDTAEKKLMAIFFYYFALVIVFVSSSATFTLLYDRFNIEISLYFLCESTGVIPGKVCEPVNLASVHITLGLVYLMISLYPLVCLLYAIDCKELKLKKRTRTNKE